MTELRAKPTLRVTSAVLVVATLLAWAALRENAEATQQTDAPTEISSTWGYSTMIRHFDSENCHPGLAWLECQSEPPAEFTQPDNLQNPLYTQDFTTNDSILTDIHVDGAFLNGNGCDGLLYEREVTVTIFMQHPAAALPDIPLASLNVNANCPTAAVNNTTGWVVPSGYYLSYVATSGGVLGPCDPVVAQVTVNGYDPS